MASPQVRSGLIGFVVGLLLGLVGIGWVWWDMRADQQAAERELTESAEMARSERATLERRNATLGARNDLLEARVMIARARMQLDERNFGAANDALDMAAAKLAAVDADTAGVNPKGLATVKQQVRDLDIQVAQDLQSQRQELHGVAMRLDDLLATRQTVTGSL